jgi:hypothetical protein
MEALVIFERHAERPHGGTDDLEVLGADLDSSTDGEQRHTDWLPLHREGCRYDGAFEPSRYQSASKRRFASHHDRGLGPMQESTELAGRRIVELGPCWPRLSVAGALGGSHGNRRQVDGIAVEAPDHQDLEGEISGQNRSNPLHGVFELEVLAHLSPELGLEPHCARLR